jgi:hypothetical protein
MGVSVVLSRAIVPVLSGRLVGSEFFEPGLAVVMRPALVVVDEDGGGSMRCLFATW